MPRQAQHQRRPKSRQRPPRPVNRDVSPPLASSVDTTGTGPAVEPDEQQSSLTELPSRPLVTRSNEDGTPPRRPRGTRPFEGRPSGSRSATVRRSVPLTLSREQEYTFIREDMRRLLVTTGILLAVMLALLFVIDR